MDLSVGILQGIASDLSAFVDVTEIPKKHLILLLFPLNLFIASWLSRKQSRG